LERSASSSVSGMVSCVMSSSIFCSISNMRLDINMWMARKSRRLSSEHLNLSARVAEE
jgi:hypothetical protein